MGPGTIICLWIWPTADQQPHGRKCGSTRCALDTNKSWVCQIICNAVHALISIYWTGNRVWQCHLWSVTSVEGQHSAAGQKLSVSVCVCVLTRLSPGPSPKCQLSTAAHKLFVICSTAVSKQQLAVDVEERSDTGRGCGRWSCDWQQVAGIAFQQRCHEV